jgi:hypothetical protein
MCEGHCIDCTEVCEDEQIIIIHEQIKNSNIQQIN